MALIRQKDLKGMSPAERSTKLEELRKELIKERAQIAVGTTPKSPGKIKQMKKTIARILQIQDTKEVHQRT